MTNVSSGGNFGLGMVLWLAGMPARCGSGVLLSGGTYATVGYSELVLTKPSRLARPDRGFDGHPYVRLVREFFFFPVVVGIDHARHPTINRGSTIEGTRT